MFKGGLSVVVPVYNEAEIIGETIQVFIAALSRLTGDFEIVFVDDGSSDGTVRIVRKYADSDARIRVFSNDKNRGSGRSLWQGFKKAQKEFVVSNFADRPFDLSELSRMLPLFESEKIDFIVVARKDRSANSFYRKITSYTNLYLIKLLFGIKIDDFQFVQIYRKKALEGVRLVSSGTFVPPELMMRLARKGSSWRQVTAVFHSRTKGRSKCGKPQVILKTIAEMARFWFYWRFCPDALLAPEKSPQIANSDLSRSA